MSLPQGDLQLLEGDVARRLLTVRPTWAGVIDSQTRLPGPLGGVQAEAGR